MEGVGRRGWGRRGERAVAAGFKTKLTVICLLVGAGVLGLMYLAEKQHGAVKLLQRGRGGAGWGLGVPLTPHRLSRRPQQLLLVEQTGSGGEGAAVSFQPSYPPLVGDVPPRRRHAHGSWWPATWRDALVRRPGENATEEAPDEGSLAADDSDAAASAAANATNGTNATGAEVDDEYPLKPLVNFWAKGDVLIAPGHQNPSHLLQTDQSLPDYRFKPAPAGNATVVVPHGPPGFLGYGIDEFNVTHALVAHNKLDVLGVNTGEESLVHDAMVAGMCVCVCVCVCVCMRL